MDRRQFMLTTPALVLPTLVNAEQPKEKYCYLGIHLHYDEEEDCLSQHHYLANAFSMEEAIAKMRKRASSGIVTVSDQPVTIHFVAGCYKDTGLYKGEECWSWVFICNKEKAILDCDPPHKLHCSIVQKNELVVSHVHLPYQFRFLGRFYDLTRFDK